MDITDVLNQIAAGRTSSPSHLATPSPNTMHHTIFYDPKIPTQPIPLEANKLPMQPFTSFMGDNMLFPATASTAAYEFNNPTQPISYTANELPVQPANTIAAPFLCDDDGNFTKKLHLGALLPCPNHLDTFRLHYRFNKNQVDYWDTYLQDLGINKQLFKQVESHLATERGENNNDEVEVDSGIRNIADARTWPKVIKEMAKIIEERDTYLDALLMEIRGIREQIINGSCRDAIIFQGQLSPFGRYVLAHWKEQLTETLGTVYTTLARLGSNLFVLFAKKDEVALFATPTYAAAVHAVCADAFTTRRAAQPEYMQSVPIGFDAKSQSAFTIQSILFSVAGIVSGDMAKRRVYGPQPPQPFRQSTATTEVTTAENMARGTMAWDVERLRLECRRRMRSLLVQLYLLALAQEDSVELLYFFPTVMRLKETQAKILAKKDVESMPWESMIQRYNWKPLSLLCKVERNADETSTSTDDIDTVLRLPNGTQLPPSVIEWDWSANSVWQEQQCRVFLLYFEAGSSKSIVIDSDNWLERLKQSVATKKAKKSTKNRKRPPGRPITAVKRRPYLKAIAAVNDEHVNSSPVHDISNTGESASTENEQLTAVSKTEPLALTEQIQSGGHSETLSVPKRKRDKNSRSRSEKSKAKRMQTLDISIRKEALSKKKYETLLEPVVTLDTSSVVQASSSSRVDWQFQYNEPDKMTTSLPDDLPSTLAPPSPIIIPSPVSVAVPPSRKGKGRDEPISEDRSDAAVGQVDRSALADGDSTFPAAKKFKSDDDVDVKKPIVLFHSAVPSNAGERIPRSNVSSIFQRPVSEKPKLFLEFDVYHDFSSSGIWYQHVNKHSQIESLSLDASMWYWLAVKNRNDLKSNKHAILMGSKFAELLQSINDVAPAEWPHAVSKLFERPLLIMPWKRPDSEWSLMVLHNSSHLLGTHTGDISSKLVVFGSNVQSNHFLSCLQKFLKQIGAMPERVDALQELYCPSELVCAGGLEIKPTGPFIVQVAISLLKSKGLEALNQSLEVASNRTVQQPWFNASDIASIDSKVTEYCRNNGTEAAVNGYYGKKHDFETYIPGPFIRGRSLFQLTEDQSSQNNDTIVTTYGELPRKLIRTLKLHDFRTADDGKWLNDEIINCFGQLIGLFSYIFDGIPSIGVASSHLLDQIEKKGLETVKKWNSACKERQVIKLLFPVNIPSDHWFLIVADLVSDQLTVYDSVNYATADYVKKIQAYLKMEYPEKSFTVSTAIDVTQQTNGFDCGVYTCMVRNGQRSSINSD